MASNLPELRSYDLFGVKESFANWVSNISPADTPFVSLTGKEAVKNKYFQWQVDLLNPADVNAFAEGEEAGDGKMRNTVVKQNVTQILRKVVKVSDTADALSNWGRGTELQYQMEKAAKEIKRDLEWVLLHHTSTDAKDVIPPSQATTNALTRVTAGFPGLVADKGIASEENTNAIVHKDATVADTLTEGDLFDITAGLYFAGAKPTHIMFNPRHAKFFTSLREASGNHERKLMFNGEVGQKINMYVSSIVDPLGQEFTLLPNRFMPTDKIYIFNPSDWTQMVLREPSRIQLAKTGSYEKWMIEMEVGLRHRNPYASGILVVGNANSGTGGSTGGTSITLGGAVTGSGITYSYSATMGATAAQVTFTPAAQAAPTAPATAPTNVTLSAFTKNGFTIVPKAAGTETITITIDGTPYTINVDVKAAPTPTLKTIDLTGTGVSGTAPAKTLVTGPKADGTGAAATVNIIALTDSGAPLPANADLVVATKVAGDASKVLITQPTGTTTRSFTVKAASTGGPTAGSTVVFTVTPKGLPAVELTVTFTA